MFLLKQYENQNDLMVYYPKTATIDIFFYLNSTLLFHFQTNLE